MCHLVSPLQNVDAVLIHCQPQVLRQHCRVALDDVKDGGPVEPPLSHKAHEGLFSITLIHVEVQEVSVPASDILRLHFDPHVAGNILLYDAPVCMQHTSRAQGGEGRGRGRDNTFVGHAFSMLRCTCTVDLSTVEMAKG